MELKTRVSAAEKNAGETLSKITALRQVLPDDDAVRSLQERVENQRRSFEHARAEAARVREGKVALTAQIEALTNSGIGQKLAELKGELQRADDDVDEIEAEVAALQLLREALQAARDTSREQLMAPFGGSGESLSRRGLRRSPPVFQGRVRAGELGPRRRPCGDDRQAQRRDPGTIGDFGAASLRAAVSRSRQAGSIDVGRPSGLQRWWADFADVSFVECRVGTSSSRGTDVPGTGICCATWSPAWACHPGMSI